MTVIVIARHGNTFATGETPCRIGRRTDLPLTDEGRRQARALGLALAATGWTPDLILSGPLSRTVESATLIAAGWPGTDRDRDHPIEHPGWLDEIDHGPDEGRPEPEVVRRLGAEALAAWDDAAVPPAGWAVDTVARLAQWREVLTARAADGRSLLCVTSNGAARFALLAAGLQTLPERLALRTGSCGAFGWSQAGTSAGQWRLLFWNRRPGDPGVSLTP